MYAKHARASKERVLCNVMVDELGDEAGTYQLDKEEHEKVLSVLGLDAQAMWSRERERYVAVCA